MTVHELSIASYLLEAVEQQAQESRARRVLAINLSSVFHACKAARDFLLRERGKPRARRLKQQG